MATDPSIIQRVKIGVLFSIVLVSSLWYFAPFPYPKDADMAERLAYAVRWLIPFPILIVYTINKVGSVRASTAASNPMGSKDEHLTVLPNKMVQNTIEQGLIYTYATLMLSLTIPPSQLPIIPALAINFFVGRMLFYWGYQRPNNLDRAYGFAMGFMINLAVMAYVSFKFVMDMILGW